MIFKILILILITVQVWAIKGVIRVLEAPVYYKPDDSTPILQNYRMGSEISIHETNDSRDFYRTFTRSGLDGYIKKDFVKIIFNDQRELNTSISHPNDPTDYIANEPLFDSYPFAREIKNKASISFNYSAAGKQNYNYTNRVIREGTNSQYSLQIDYLKRANFNSNDRLYYGAIASWQTGQNDYQLENKIFTVEKTINIGAGPIIKYTSLRYERLELDLFLSFLINYSRIFVDQDNISSVDREEINFSGFSIRSKLGFNLIHRNMFNDENIDITHGPAVDIILPHTLNADRDPTLSEYWSSTGYKVPFQAGFSYQVGVTLRY